MTAVIETLDQLLALPDRTVLLGKDGTVMQVFTAHGEPYLESVGHLASWTPAEALNSAPLRVLAPVGELREQVAADIERIEHYERHDMTRPRFEVGGFYNDVQWAARIARGKEDQ